MNLLRKTDNLVWDSLLELRVNALHKIVWVIGLCGWLALIWALWPVTGIALERELIRPASFLLLIVAVLSYFLIRQNAIILAAIVQLVGVTISTMLAIGVFHSIDTLYLFAIPVILASILLGHRAVIATTCAAVAFNAIVAPRWLAMPWQGFITSTAVLCLIAMVVIISTRNLYTALWWALDSFETARYNQDIAREHKAELQQALKSLDIAAYNLRRMNYALSVAQKRADEARQLKQKFAQTISHELRTPLNLIVGFTEAMIQSPEHYGELLPPRYLRDLSIVYRNANHLQNLVNDVLDLARIEAAQMTLQIEAQALTVFVDDVIQMARSMTETEGLLFRAEIEDNLPIVCMDAIRLKQVIYNLLNNAVRFTPEGTISFRVSGQPQAILFEISDTGIGIDAADIARIFEPFCQLENPMRRRVGGAGLGLPISRQLVEMHGGTLDVRSEAGKGSTFYFHIPLGSEAVAGEMKDVSDLVVRPLEIEDENLLIVVTRSPSAASLITRYLDTYRTVAVRDFAEVAATTKRLIPQAILVDTNSVTMDLDRIAALDPLAQAMVIACPLPGEALLSSHLSVNGYLIKPVSRMSLLNTLQQYNGAVEKVLVADDDPDFVRMIERMLDTPVKRYQLDRAHSGRETLMKIDRNQPDLVLLDLQMPDMDGFQVIEEIRSSPELKDMLVIIVSAQEKFDTSRLANGYLTVTKPQGIATLELVHWLQGLLT